MTKHRRTWIIFALVLGAIVAAMAWISHFALQLEDAEIELRRQTLVEENVRLALWRMDSSLAALIAEESSRPPHTYSAFYSLGQAYSRELTRLESDNVFFPSPLLTLRSPLVHLYFQINADASVTSPQVPEANMRERAEADRVPPAARIEKFSGRLEELRSGDTAAAVLEVFPIDQTKHDIWNVPTVTWSDRLLQARASDSTSPVEQQEIAPPTRQRAQIAEQYLGQNSAAQSLRNRVELAARSNTFKKVERQQALKIPNFACFSQPGSTLLTRTMTPYWIDGRLFLLRPVHVNGRESIQGCWLEWETLETSLLEDIADLLPEADLRAVSATAPGTQSRMLAALPVEVIPGDVPGEPITSSWPIRFPLAVAWGCVLLAATAIGVLLQGALTLSERRGAFVSAVTHELRTPLTTFRMYTEMLARKMVPEEAKQQRYLETLHAESSRLGHMVENVLSYARLEKGREAAHIEEMSVGTILDKVGEPLADRARQAEMKLDINADNRDLRLRADLSAVEQILTNLVDNACKYAGAAADLTIHLEVDRPGGNAVRFQVRDHGPGVTRTEAKRLFRPFSKSAHEAANSAPGVGLGLSLSRRLARAMGGDLTLERRDDTDGAGACFTLALPGV